MRLRSIAVNISVTAAAFLVALLLCEAGARLFLDPADYLSVTTSPDKVLGIAIAANTSGLDGWGFRNPAVPAEVDVVALGDSHTFGNTATMADAWPSVLGRDAKLDVYNLGLGGYGPNQYYHLLTTRGVSLRPKRVLCGLYMGDDFENAFSITYGLDYWASLRTGRYEGARPNIWGDPTPAGPLKDLRTWLSRESLTYRLAVHGPALGAIKEAVRFSRASRTENPLVTTLEIPDQKIREAFRPIGIAARLDQSRPEVREGMRITFHLLKAMDRVCRENGCSLAVVIIPTKETVFGDYLQRDPDLHLRAAVDSIITNERAARAELGEFLNEAGIPFVDTLPALRQAVGQGLYAATTADMHPGRNGYRVIAAAAREFLHVLEAPTN